MPHPALLTDREMRILSLLTIASLSLVIVCSTWNHAQSVNATHSATEPSGALLEHQAQSTLSTTQLHPAILPILALSGRTLHAPTGSQQQPQSDTPHDPSAQPSAAEIPLPSRLLRKLSTGAGVHFAPQQPARPVPGSQSALVPLPLPVPQAIPAGHPKPCFRDC